MNTLARLVFIGILTLTTPLWFPLVMRAGGWVGRTYWEQGMGKVLAEKQQPAKPKQQPAKPKQ